MKDVTHRLGERSVSTYVQLRTDIGIILTVLQVNKKTMGNPVKKRRQKTLRNTLKNIPLRTQ